MHRVGRTDDGLYYDESEVSELKITPYKWLNSSPLSDGYFKNYKNRGGPGTLADMALRCTLHYRHLLTAEALRNMPWEPFGLKLWSEIKSKKGLTVALWKSFIHAYHGSRQDIDASLRVCHAPVVLPLDLLSATIPLLQSTRTNFLTILHVSNPAIDLSRWMDICKLQNLRGLFINASIQHCGFDERVAKGWANHATEGGAFAHLRTLSISTRWGETLTYQTLVSLSRISSLQVLLVRGFHVTEETGDHGWDFSDHNDTAKAILSQEDYSAISFIDVDDRSGSKSSAESGTHCPRLVVRIGPSYDTSLRKDQYPDWKSFNVAVRSQEFVNKRKLCSSAEVHKISSKKPKVRKNAQQGVDDMLNSFQR